MDPVFPPKKVSKQHHLWFSLVAVIVLPLLPILTELFVKRDCLDATLVITTAVYSATVFSSSRNPVSFLLAIMTSGLLCALYINLINSEAYSKLIESMTNKASPPSSLPKELPFSHSHDWTIILISIFLILVIALIHGAERYKRHIGEDEPFIQSYK